jgi:hypothetical protein
MTEPRTDLDIIDRPTLLLVASDADCDPRTVEAELAAYRGERAHVRGIRGRRIRAALVRRGIVQTEAA